MVITSCGNVEKNVEKNDTNKQLNEVERNNEKIKENKIDNIKYYKYISLSIDMKYQGNVAIDKSKAKNIYYKITYKDSKPALIERYCGNIPAKNISGFSSIRIEPIINSEYNINQLKYTFYGFSYKVGKTFKQYIRYWTGRSYINTFNYILCDIDETDKIYRCILGNSIDDEKYIRYFKEENARGEFEEENWGVDTILARKFYFNNNRLVKLVRGQLVYQWEYDEIGNPIECSIRDINGNRNKFGAAQFGDYYFYDDMHKASIIKNSYNGINLTETAYYDEHEKFLGRHKYYYDDRSNLIKVEYFNEHNHLRDDLAIVKLIYDQKERLTKIINFDKNNKLIGMNSGDDAIIKLEYSRDSESIELITFDKNNIEKTVSRFDISQIFALFINELVPMNVINSKRRGSFMR